MKVATALLICKIGVGLTVALLAAEFGVFYLHLFVVPVMDLPFTLVLIMLPALIGVSAYQRALKAEAARESVKAD